MTVYNIPVLCQMGDFPVGYAFDGLEAGRHDIAEKEGEKFALFLHARVPWEFVHGLVAELKELDADNINAEPECDREHLPDGCIEEGRDVWVMNRHNDTLERVYGAVWRRK